MKFFVAGKSGRDLEALLVSAGFSKDAKTPDIVFCIGGDGTILLAEAAYPSVPKVAIRKSKICKKCVFDEKEIEKVVRIIKEKKYGIKEYMKLDANAAGKKISALNEIQMRNENPTKAIRFSVHSRGVPIEDEVIGDGIVIATPYGSGAYYYSVGGEQFKSGIGIGFNNPHKRIKSRVVGEDSVIEVKILRGNANVFRDNSEDIVPVPEGGTIRVVKSKNVARFVVENEK